MWRNELLLDDFTIWELYNSVPEQVVQIPCEAHCDFFCPFPLLQVCPKLLSPSHTNLLHLQEATLASFPTRHPPWDLKTSSHTVPLPDVVSPNSG